MKKLMNAVDDILTESLDGFAAAHAGIVKLGAGRKFVQRLHLIQVPPCLASSGAAARICARRPV